MTLQHPPPSDMAQVMAILMQVAATWSAMTGGSESERETKRLEVLGALVQLLARRFHGFREVPDTEDLRLEVRDGGITLRVRSPGRVPLASDVVERQLAKHGFTTERMPGTENRELVLSWTREPCATVIELPRDRVLSSRRRRLR